MLQDILQKNIAPMIKIDGLSAKAQAKFTDEIGAIIMEATLTRLVGVLTEEQQYALDQYLETEPEGQALLTHLADHYTFFETILEEVVAEFKENTLAHLHELHM